MLTLEQTLLVEQLSKAAFVLLWIPFILLVSIALVDPLAAVWTSFSFSLFTLMMDVLLSMAGKRDYPMIISTWSLAAYIFNILMYYTEPSVSSAFYGPIVLTVLFLAIAISIGMKTPFSMQFQHGVDRDSGLLMGQGEILEAHMWLSKLFLIVFAIMLVCSYCSTVFTERSDPGYIILGLIIPILLPVLGVCLIPAWMKLMTPSFAYDGVNTGNEDDYDDGNEDIEKLGFLRSSKASI